MSVTDSRYQLASKLAKFFRKNGDKIINGSCKLSLTTSALCLLNSLFMDILNQELHIHLDFSDSSGNRVYEDVKYLYDFMQKTSSLKLFHGMQTLRGGVDLSHFSNLTVLELRKIPAHLIIGLNSLSVQLKALICTRSIYLLKELFGSTADEQNTTDVWTELRELNLSYNYLESLDQSIRSIPNIEILDLSHNNIKSTEDIQVLKRLSCVNLSYNQLESLPVFNSLSCRFMNKLFVRNNHLERLDGLECLFNLEELDVGYNLLSEYSVLTPLDKLKSLKMLNLEGNPLFFHNQHLRLTIKYLNPFVLNRGLHLNGKFIAIPQNLTNTIDGVNEINGRRHQTSLNTVVGDMQNVIRPPAITAQSLKGASHLISISSDISSFDDNSPASSYSSQNSIEQAIATGTKQKRKSKSKSKSNVTRVAVINEPEEVDGESDFLKSTNSGKDLRKQSLVREMVEARRKERGESWLIPDRPFDKLGQELKVPANTPESRPMTNDISKDLIINLETVIESQKLENNSSIAMNNELKEVLEIQKENNSDSGSERKRHISKESDDIEILASNSQEISSNLEVPSAEDCESDCDFYESANFKNSSTDFYDDEDTLQFESEDETEDSLFFVEKLDKTKSETISVNIGAKHAIEKDTTTGKILDKLDLSILYSIKRISQEKDGIKSCEVHLEFDTVKTSRKQRVYVFGDIESAKRMCEILQPFADASTLKEATLGALECMNCKSQFSRLVAERKVLKTDKPTSNQDALSSNLDKSKGYVQEAIACPNCKNHFVVELESIPLPSVAAPPSAGNKLPNVVNSPLSSSVGSSSSGQMFSNFLSTFKLSPSAKRKSSAEQSKQNLGDISPKINDENIINDSDKDYAKRRGSESQMSRNSSGITIISNPSQSSIAIIPEPTMDTNLNTIIERESQISLSPPTSRNSNLFINNVSNENDQLQGPENTSAVSGEGFAVCAKEDPDFYSITDSIGGEKERPFKNSDIVSNDSDIFYSPHKSVGSSNGHTDKKVDDSDKLMQILGSKSIVTPDSFVHLDHRLKLHIEINIFDKDENMNCCLQTSIVPLSTGEEFEGLFLLSSKKVYVIRFLSQYTQALENSESLHKQVQILYSGSLKQVKQIKVLLGNQGISIACGPPTHVYTLIIRDVDTCNTFSNLISEQFHEVNPAFECLSSTEEMLQILHESVLTAESNEGTEILLHQFAFQKDKDLTFPICVTLTKDNIYLSKVLYKKQQSCPDLSKMQAYTFGNFGHHEISDVVSLKLNEHFTTVEICFLIESSDVESTSWTIEMPTKSAMFSFVSALKNPWEELFAVPLPLSMNENR